MDYQWLLFDADGTLFDYDLAEAKALQETFTEMALVFGPEHSSTYRKINRQVWVDFENGLISAEALRVRRFELMFDTLEITADAASFSERYLAHLGRAGDLMDGAEEVIRKLHDRFHLGIITNGLKDVQRPRLAVSSIAHLFEVVAISEELGVAKPDPRFFEVVFAKIGSPPKANVLVIGDSLTSDIQGGINSGLDTCWFNPLQKPADPRFPATYEIQALPQLLNLLAFDIQ